jgi:hypothetical protein
MGSGGEKVLAAELILSVTVIWVAEVWSSTKAQSTVPAIPKPQQLAGTALLFAGLALVAMFGPQSARLAAGVGGLSTLVVVLKGAGAVAAATGAGPQNVAGVAGNPNPEGVIPA